MSERPSIQVAIALIAAGLAALVWLAIAEGRSWALPAAIGFALNLASDIRDTQRLDGTRP